MLDSLTNQDMIILFVLIGLIIVVGILCIIFSLKGNKVEKKVVKEEKKVSPKKTVLKSKKKVVKVVKLRAKNETN